MQCSIDVSLPLAGAAAAAPELARQLSVGSFETAPMASAIVDEQVEADEGDELLAERSGSESDLPEPEQEPIALDVNYREFRLAKNARERDVRSDGAQSRKKMPHASAKPDGTPFAFADRKKGAKPVDAAAAGFSSSHSPSPSHSAAAEPKQSQTVSAKPLPPHPTSSVELVSSWRSLRQEPRLFYDYFIVRFLSFCICYLIYV